MSLNLNRTQSIFLDLLADNRPHNRVEFKRLLDGEYTSYHTVSQHMYTLRNKLNPIGSDVISFRSCGQVYYQKIIKIT